MSTMPAARSSLPAPGSPELLHARLVLPPALAWNGERYSGARLQRIDAAAALAQPGVRQVFVRKHLVAVVATSDEAARAARSRVRISWSAADDTRLPRAQARTLLLRRGATADAPPTSAADYRWQAPAPPLDSATLAVLATPVACGLRIDLPFGSPALVAAELAALLGMPAAAIEVRSHRAAQPGAETRAASSAAAIAALLCREYGTPLSLLMEAAAEAAPPALLRLRASADADTLAQQALDFEVAAAPPLAWLLTGMPYAAAQEAAPAAAALASPYDWATIEIASTGGDTLAPAAAVFAQEAFFDELAEGAGQDPVAYRLAHLPDPRGGKLVRSVADAARWQPGARTRKAGDQVLRGRGFAYASSVEAQPAGPIQTWSAWVADVEYDRGSGELSVTRVVAGHDLAPAAQDAAGPAMAAPRALLDELARAAAAQLIAPAQGFDAWSALPAATASSRLPAVDVLADLPAHRSGEVQLQAGDAFTLPAAAAVANAIYDATGVRLRSAPFSGEEIALALSAQEGARPRWRLKKAGWIGAAAAALGTAFTLALPWRPAIAPVPKPDPNLYSAATIERGRLVALAGDCMVCHTAPGGAVNAGGHALDTPFGKIYTTNITPDEKTGIGNWSYAAFERAMREGVHQDGRNLYPAFPYTAYAKMSEADMQSLYAWLMAQPAVESTPPPNELAFPFNLRPLLSGWKALFHKPEVFQPDPTQSALWNRGAYLVEGAGHCAACHSPRNLLGAEKKGLYHLAGGSVDGWEAPALTANSKAPTPWTEDELFTYLRTGFSARHGTAAGPMAPVVAELAQLPAGDVRAMAHYLVSLNTKAAPVPAVQSAAAVDKAQAVRVASGQRLFQGACAACHMEGSGPQLFGVRPSLRVNTNVHSDKPDNLINVILHGIREPANPELGYMPGFADSLSDAQIADLLTWMRSDFAPDKSAWDKLEAQVAAGRQRAAHE